MKDLAIKVDYTATSNNVEICDHHPLQQYTVSVIVPVYGVEQWIEKCVLSLVNQRFTERFEVLFINDGTLDASALIIEALIAEIDDFHLISKINGGAADARNVGLRAAKGRYICFVDGDDYVHEDYLQTLYQLILDSGAEISQAEFLYVDVQSGRITQENVYLPTRLINGVEMAKGIDVMRNVPGIWRRMYSRDFIVKNNLYFNSEFRRHDDLPFNILTLLLADWVAIGRQAVYMYVIGREGQDISATDRRLFIHFRLFDAVFLNGNITGLDRYQYRQFLKTMFSHHLWAYTRLQLVYRKSYRAGFCFQIFNSTGLLNKARRFITLLKAFPKERGLLLILLTQSFRVRDREDIVSDLPSANAHDRDGM